MTMFTSRVLPAGALAAIMAGLFIGAEAQAIKSSRAENAGPKTGQLILGPAEFTPYRQTAVLAELCMAPAGEVYSHVGIADEAVRPFASCLR